jgi:hypothetical protein
LALLAASVADGRSSRANACGAREYSYAGLQSDSKGHGVGATLVPLRTPAVSAGHVGAWIGVGGVNLGPNGTAEWLQVGFSAFPSDRMNRIYYEVTVPGSDPRYVELDSSVKAGEKHSFKVLEMARLARRQSRQPGDPPSREPRRVVSAGDGRELERRGQGMQRIQLRLFERHPGVRRRRRLAAPDAKRLLPRRRLPIRSDLARAEQLPRSEP